MINLPLGLQYRCKESEALLHMFSMLVPIAIAFSNADKAKSTMKFIDWKSSPSNEYESLEVKGEKL